MQIGPADDTVVAAELQMNLGIRPVPPVPSPPGENQRASTSSGPDRRWLKFGRWSDFKDSVSRIRSFKDSPVFKDSFFKDSFSKDFIFQGFVLRNESFKSKFSKDSDDLFSRIRFQGFVLRGFRINESLKTLEKTNP
jgi:hypothetical protein